MNERDILLKLRRRYSDSEVHALLIKDCKRLEQELGEMKSEVAHLEALVKELKEKNEAMRKVIKGQSQGQGKIQNKFVELQKQVMTWRDRYLNLVASQNKTAPSIVNPPPIEEKYNSYRGDVTWG